MLRFYLFIFLIALTTGFVVYKLMKWTKPVKSYVDNKEQEALNKLDKKLNQ